jgi:SAM-dependent methyltransferase
MMKDKQCQTSKAFSFKWAKRDTYESEAFKKKLYEWSVKRYFGNEDERERFLEENRGKKFLDAGCGSCLSTAVLFGSFLNDMEYLGVDISDSIKTAKDRFNELGIKGDFLQESIATMKLKQKFDIIYSSGVIHHTSSPFESFRNLVSHLSVGGIIMFYIYKKKAPIREFADDFIREKISHLSDEEAWEELVPLSKLGKVIGDLNIEVEVDEEISLLEIPKGKYNLQRLLYWFFIKMYYDEKFSIDEMNHINFDWYRPLNCHRLSPDEIKGWLKNLELEKLRFYVEESGITVIARKNKQK